MSDIINVHEAKAHLSKLLELAHSGQEIILGKAGKPYARLVPLAKEPGRLPGKVDEGFFGPLPADELDAWEGR